MTLRTSRPPACQRGSGSDPALRRRPGPPDHRRVPAGDDQGCLPRLRARAV